MNKTIAFTGTRKGLTLAQRRALHDLLDVADEHLFLHGDAVGADTEAAGIALSLGYAVRAYPAGDDPLARNRLMVDQADRVIACPHGPEIVRSGTWATIRYARRSNKPCLVIWPEGDVSV